MHVPIYVSYSHAQCQIALVNACLAAVTGYILFQFVVRNQPKKRARKTKVTPTPSQNILVYGLLIPFWATIPYCSVQGLRIRHMIFRFVLGVMSPILSLLRTTEGEIITDFFLSMMKYIL